MDFAWIKSHLSEYNMPCHWRQAVASYSTISRGLCGGSHMQSACNYPSKGSYEPVSHGNTVLTRAWCRAVHTKVHTSVFALNPFSGKTIDRHITPKKAI